MPPTKVILLACGSFNPITNMHLRMFEIARDHLHRMGSHTVIGGLVSPVHDTYGKKDLEASTHRLAMLKLALQTSDWIKLSDWECRQETWSKTRQVLQYHQNHVNSLLHLVKNNQNNGEFEDDNGWLPEDIKNGGIEPVQVKLLCGADLLESFGTPGLWADDDIEAIVGHHGLIVITRSKSDPLEFIYNSDVLTKYMANITVVTEWIRNEVSSTKIRRALRRNESVRYLLPDKVVDYIHRHSLYGSKYTKYLNPYETNSNFLTPSPSDITMESPSPTTNNCMIICNNALFSAKNNQNYEKQTPQQQQMSIDTVDSSSGNSVTKANNLINVVRHHPGQAVKIITESTGDHRIVRDSKEGSTADKNERNNKEQGCSSNTKNPSKYPSLKHSKSYTSFDEQNTDSSGKKVVRSTSQKKTSSSSNSNSNSGDCGGKLKECKSCDENLVKFIFTKHGIQIISDVETIV